MRHVRITPRSWPRTTVWIAGGVGLALVLSGGPSGGSFALAGPGPEVGQPVAATTTPSAPHDPSDTGDDPVIAAAGDIACSIENEQAAEAEGDDMQCQQKNTAALLQDPAITAVLALGDTQYYDGDPQQFSQMYGASWGSVINKTFPVPGNHEYYGPDGVATGYFSYFGARAGQPSQGWYSFDLGKWHLIALNTGDCTAVGGCSPAFSGHPASPQYTWLVNDLAAHPNQCTLAFWHQPVFGGGEEGGTRALGGLFSALYNAHADVVLNGYNHDYERFGQQDAQGNAEPGRGVREFIVGTGGKDQQDFLTLPPNTERRFNDSFGVLKMTLRPTSYDWQFVDAEGSHSTDSGSDTCHVVKPTISVPPTLLRGSPLVVTGTAIPTTPVKLDVKDDKSVHDVVVQPDASGNWTTTLPTRPDSGTIRLTATSGPQVSDVASVRMTGTTVTGPATSARGSRVVLSGLAEPNRAVTVFVTRPAAKPLAIKTKASDHGTYSVVAPVNADASWFAVSNSYHSTAGHTHVHGLTASAPATATAGKPVVFQGLAEPGAKVTIFTRSAHAKSAVGHAVRADAHGAYRVSITLAVTTSWWATSGGVRTPVHAIKVTSPTS